MLVHHARSMKVKVCKQQSYKTCSVVPCFCSLIVPLSKGNWIEDVRLEYHWQSMVLCTMFRSMLYETCCAAHPMLSMATGSMPLERLFVAGCYRDYIPMSWNQISTPQTLQRISLKLHPTSITTTCWMVSSNRKKTHISRLYIRLPCVDHQIPQNPPHASQ